MVEPDNDNESVLLEFFAAMSAKDTKRIGELLHEQATWTPQVRDVPLLVPHRGRKSIMEDFLAPAALHFRPGDPKLICDTIASKGPLVFAEAHSEGCFRNGVPYENLYAWVVEIRDRQLYTIREYTDSHYVVSLQSKIA